MMMTRRRSSAFRVAGSVAQSSAAAHITTGSAIVPSQECLITAQSGKFNSSKTFFLQHKEERRMSVHHTDTAADESFFCESISF